MFVERELNRVMQAPKPTFDAKELQQQVRRLRARGPVTKPEDRSKAAKREASSTVFSRDPSVIAYVLQRAKGRCEACGKAAPFELVTGEPFLEVHHLRRLADGGSDRVENATAACPNCHRRLHYGKDAAV